MNSKHAALLAANRHYSDLIKQHRHVNDRLPVMATELNTLTAEIEKASSQLKHVRASELRGIATPQDVARAEEHDTQLRDHFRKLSLQIEAVRDTGGSMVGEIADAKAELDQALNLFCMDTTGALTKPIGGDAKLRQKLLEIHAGIVLSGNLRPDLFIEDRWSEMLSGVFTPPAMNEHLAALEEFKAKHQLPTPGAASATELVTA